MSKSQSIYAPFSVWPTAWTCNASLLFKSQMVEDDNVEWNLIIMLRLASVSFQCCCFFFVMFYVFLFCLYHCYTAPAQRPSQCDSPLILLCVFVSFRHICVSVNTHIKTFMCVHLFPQLAIFYVIYHNLELICLS